jgi:hypothetical protein
LTKRGNILIHNEILKLISEKDNKVLKQYRQSYIKLQEENSQLIEKIELQVLSFPNTVQDENSFQSGKIDKKSKIQAGAELCQAHIKVG